MSLIFLSFAPVLIIAFYVYFRDKYEKEPLQLLLKALGAGALSMVPVFFVEQFLSLFTPDTPGPWEAGYTAFIVAGVTEELFKYLFLVWLVWRNPNFNEKFDGIVYAVFVSLGFAGVENVIYVMANGTGVGITRALTAVPAHALFGVVMGFHLGIARMVPELRTRHLWLAVLVPILLHGIYDFIIMSGYDWGFLLFLPYLAFLWFNGFRKMNIISDSSRFRKHYLEDEE
jgi:RsiW-degrading membrane proteinase PrsW (M82 family)